MKLAASVSCLALAIAACTTASPDLALDGAGARVAAASNETGTPGIEGPRAVDRTPEGARQFIAEVEKDLLDFSNISSRAQWVNATYITDDTDALAAYFGTIGTEKGVAYAKEAAEFAKVQGLDPDTARKLNILRGALVLAAPSTGGAAAELNTISTRLSSTYGKGRATLDGKTITGDVAEESMGELRNPAKTAEVWTSWHNNVGRPMRQDYTRMVEIANQGSTLR